MNWRFSLINFTCNLVPPTFEISGNQNEWSCLTRMNKLISFLLIMLCTTIVAQDVAVVRSLSLNIKRNGLFLQIKANRKIAKTEVTAWQASNKWFYVTIMNAAGDTAVLSATKPAYPVLEVQALTINNTVQLGFKLARKIDYFEFQPSDVSPGIILSLNFPVQEVLVALEEERDNGQIESQAPATDQAQPEKAARRYRNRRNAGYLAGATLAVGGLLQPGDRFGWETTAGLSIIAATYCYDRFLRTHLRRD